MVRDVWEDREDGDDFGALVAGLFTKKVLPTTDAAPM